MVLAVEAREGPNSQDRAGQDMTATYHPHGVAEVAGTSSNTEWAFPTALEEIRCRSHRRGLRSVFMKRC